MIPIKSSRATILALLLFTLSVANAAAGIEDDTLPTSVPRAPEVVWSSAPTVVPPTATQLLKVTLYLMGGEYHGAASTPATALDDATGDAPASRVSLALWSSVPVVIPPTATQLAKSALYVLSGEDHGAGNEARPARAMVARVPVADPAGQQGQNCDSPEATPAGLNLASYQPRITVDAYAPPSVSREHYVAPNAPATFAAPASIPIIRSPTSPPCAARPQPQVIAGCVERVDSRDAMAVIRISGRQQPEIGDRFKVYHRFLFTGPTVTGELEVAGMHTDGLLCRPVGSMRLPKISKGDRVVYTHDRQ